MLKEFKNGNVNVKVDRVFDNGEKVYNYELTMLDYYIEVIDGYMYLVNMRIERVYDLSDYYTIQDFFNAIEEVIKLIPYGKRDSKKFINEYILSDYQY